MPQPNLTQLKAHIIATAAYDGLNAKQIYRDLKKDDPGTSVDVKELFLTAPDVLLLFAKAKDLSAITGGDFLDAMFAASLDTGYTRHTPLKYMLMSLPISEGGIDFAHREMKTQLARLVLAAAISPDWGTVITDELTRQLTNAEVVFGEDTFIPRSEVVAAVNSISDDTRSA